MKKITLLFLFVLFSVGLIAQATAQDSLMQYLIKNQNNVKAIVDGYEKVAFNWKQFLVTFGGFIFLAFLTWRLWAKEKFNSYVKQKAQEAVESLSNLKTANILVLSSETGNTTKNDLFLKSFLKAKKFPNVHFERIADKFKPISDFSYDVVFANNEDNLLDKAVVRQYAHEDVVIFYFGKPASWDFQNDAPEISKKINFANSRAQIYGNLMSSLEFLQATKPEIKNI